MQIMFWLLIFWLVADKSSIWKLLDKERVYAWLISLGWSFCSITTSTHILQYTTYICTLFHLLHSPNYVNIHIFCVTHTIVLVIFHSRNTTLLFSTLLKWREKLFCVVFSWVKWVNKSTNQLFALKMSVRSKSNQNIPTCS